MTSLEARIHERNEAHKAYRAAHAAYRAFQISDEQFEAARAAYSNSAARVSWGEEV